jgi:CxxC motif-containing protein (DUF1111 family)
MPRRAAPAHGGEATASRENFEELSEADKEKLIIFLESL